MVLSDTEVELGATQLKERVKDDVTWEWGQLPQVGFLLNRRITASALFAVAFMLALCCIRIRSFPDVCGHITS